MTCRGTLRMTFTRVDDWRYEGLVEVKIPAFAGMTGGLAGMTGEGMGAG